MRQGWLGVDIGTTSTKALVYDDAGRTLASARVPTVWTTDAEGTVIDPDVLRSGALAAAGRAAADTPSDVAITGIGLASMGETGVLVDGHGRPVAPAIAWHDPRDGAEVTALGEQIGRAQFERQTGKPLRSQFSLTKHRWLVDHHRATRAAVRRFNVAEWVARGLGADEACELSLAGRTGWYDLFAGDWDDRLLAWSGASRSLMPPLVAAGTAIGTVRADGVHPRLRGAVVTLCGHDHQTAALGCGAERPGDELDSSGTAEALVRTVDPTLTAAEVGTLAAAGITVDASIQRGRWSLLGGTQGGLIMGRTLRLLGVDQADLPALDAAALAMEGLAVGESAVGLPGAGDPGGDGVGALAVTVDDGEVRLTVAGDASPGALWRAVVDAVTREAAGLHDTISAVVGPHARIVAAGGWCASAMVRDAKRRLLGDFDLAGAEEPGTFGAAILAARAAGHLPPDGRLDSDRAGSDRAGTDRAGTGRAGSDRAGSAAGGAR